MPKIKLPSEFLEKLITLSKSNVYLEGQLLKFIDTSTLKGEELVYIDTASKLYKEKLLKIGNFQNAAAQQEKTNEQLALLNKELASSKIELELALKESQEAKHTAENELDILQKKTETQSRSFVIKFSLVLIGSILTASSILYIIVVLVGNHQEASILGNLVATLFVAGLSSAFGQIAVILGLKESERKS